MTVSTKLKKRIYLGTGIVGVVVMMLAAMLVHGQPSRQETLLAAAPSELVLPADPQQLGTWCRDRKAQGTAGLSLHARAWLNDCIAIFGGPTPSPTVNPSSSSSPSSSPIPSPTITPTINPSPSTTPPPSPSPTAGLNDCLHHLAECGFPNAANTGPTGALAVVNGNLSLDSDGQVLADTEVRGCVEVHGQGVTIRNVRVVGDGCFWGIINHSTGLTIEDSEVSCGGNGTAIGPANLYVVRTEIRQCENGFHVDGHVTVRDSWIHDMITSGGAHTDGAQLGQGAEFVLLDHNTVDIPAPGGTSAVIMWDEGDPQNREVLISGNLLSGGTYTLYCGRTGAVVNVTITSNRFGTFEFGYANACNSGEVWTGNVRDSDGATIGAQ
jgi:hypothetical protein